VFVDIVVRVTILQMCVCGLFGFVVCLGIDRSGCVGFGEWPIVGFFFFFFYSDFLEEFLFDFLLGFDYSSSNRC
jgi:hypothetical protein